MLPEHPKRVFCAKVLATSFKSTIYDENFGNTVLQPETNVLKLFFLIASNKPLPDCNIAVFLKLTKKNFSGCL